MIDSLSTATQRIVAVALDGLSMQQRVIANNIANANTAGFVPQSMSFESALRAAANESNLNSLENLKTHLGNVDKAISSGSFLRAENGSHVQLDMEMAALDQTVLKYEALIHGLNQYTNLTTMAILGNGGK